LPNILYFMNNACIDIGNSFIKFAAFSGDQMTHYELIEKKNTNKIIHYLQENNIKRAILSSVAEVPDDILSFVQQHCSFFINLDHQTPVPVINLYQTKETLGKDRLAAVVGAHYLYPEQNILVIDAGSAITYDFINSRGEYLGGNIAPGIKMRYKALNEFTSRLPLIEPAIKVPSIGKTTHEAIQAGVQQGIIFEVDGTIAFLKESYPDLKVLLTGGDIKYFDNRLKNLIFVVSNLVLIGLNRILNYNA
jgi:type III pantothenate kinase